MTPERYRNVLKSLRSTRDLLWRRKMLTRKLTELRSVKSCSLKKRALRSILALRFRKEFLKEERPCPLANARTLPCSKNFSNSLSLEVRSSVSRKRFRL